MSSPLAGFSQLGRLREISLAIARWGFGRMLEQARVFQLVGVRPREGPEARGDAARRLRHLLEELGPTFVKLGQVLSTRADLVSADVVRELEALQDRVAPLPFETVRAEVEQALGKPLGEAFGSFDEEPLASASIAQVHAATTNAGIRVVVKVRRPGVGERIKSDLEVLRLLARLTESVFEETHVASPTELVQELERAVLDELDFRREASNLAAFKRANQGRSFVVVPHVLDHLSTDSVLTLERLEGTRITELDPERHDRAAVARNLIETAFVQLFEDGLFHGDPHPGNLLVLPGNRIGLLDLGLVGRLSTPMRETLVVMCLAVALEDSGTLARLLYRVGIASGRVRLSELSADIQTVLDRHLGRELSELDSRSLLADLLELARRHQLRIPREYAVLAKSAITIEGVARTLCPDLDVLEVAMPYARRLLYDRLNPAGEDASARRLLLQLQGLASDVPGQVAQVLLDLEAGRLNVTSHAVEERLTQVVSSVRLLAFSVISAAVALAGVVAAGRPGVPASVAWISIGAAVLIFGAAFAWLVLDTKPKRLEASRLRR